MARSKNEWRQRRCRPQTPVGVMHQRSQSIRLDSHISLGLNNCVQIKQKDWRSEANSETGLGSGRTIATIKEHEEEKPLVSLRQKRGLIMEKDPRSGGDGRFAVGIKNRYSLALQGHGNRVIVHLCFGPCPCEQQQPLHLIRLWGMLSWDVRSVGRLLLLDHQQQQSPWLLLLLQLLMRCPTTHESLRINTERKPQITTMVFFLQNRKHHHHHHQWWG